MPIFLHNCHSRLGQEKSLDSTHGREHHQYGYLARGKDHLDEGLVETRFGSEGGNFQKSIGNFLGALWSIATFHYDFQG